MDADRRCDCSWTHDLVRCGCINGVDNISEMHGHSLGSVFVDGADGLRFGVDSQNFVE